MPLTRANAVTTDNTTVEFSGGVLRVKPGGIGSTSLADTIANFSQSAWSSGTTYVIGDMVAHKGGSYICILGHSNNEPPNATYWVPVTNPDSSYHLVCERGTGAFNSTNITSAATWIFGQMTSSVLGTGSNSSSQLMFYIDPADYAVPEAGASDARTLKARVTHTFASNGTTFGTFTSTAGLYPITAFGAGGASTGPSITLGTVTSGSTAAVTNPGTTASVRISSGDFTFPAAGHYVLAIASSAAAPASANANCRIVLERRWI